MEKLPMPEVKELCQWERELHQSVINPPIFEQNWCETCSNKIECIDYEWPEGNVK